MGFASVGSASVLLVSILYTGALIIDVHADSGRAIDDSRQALTDRHLELLNADIEIKSVSGAGTVSVVVENIGDVPLDATSMIVLFDNEPQTITSQLINGAATAVWPAGQMLSLQVTHAGPSSVTVATTSGVADTWRI